MSDVFRASFSAVIQKTGEWIKARERKTWTEFDWITSTFVFELRLCESSAESESDSLRDPESVSRWSSDLMNLIHWINLNLSKSTAPCPEDDLHLHHLHHHHHHHCYLLRLRLLGRFFFFFCFILSFLFILSILIHLHLSVLLMQLNRTQISLLK